MENQENININGSENNIEQNRESTNTGKLENVIPESEGSYFKSYNNTNLYNNARSCAVKVLCRCERTDSYLEKLIDTEIKNSPLNDFDKSLLSELANGVIRWLRRLDWFLNGFYRGQYEKCLPEIKNAMRVALYQILFLNKIPYSAAVNEAVEFVKRIHGEKHAGVVNGLLRTIIRTLDNLVWPTREIDEVNYLGLVQSHPNWMVRRWISRFGFDETQKLCEANNRRPYITLRVNKFKTTAEEVKKYFSEQNISIRETNYLDYFFTVKTFSKIYRDEFFKKGYFTIQDESAGLVSHLTAPREDDIILDVCAAPGGKATHLAELIKDRGRIIAVEKYFSRVEVLKNNIERTGFTNIEAIHDDIVEPKTDILKRELLNNVDIILVDAPCSGLGIISKKPDIKWKREPKDIRELQKIQSEILESSVKYLKQGKGVIVYSTCTTEQEENSDVVKIFLQSHPEFSIDDARNYVDGRVVNNNGCIELFPHIHHTDGAFSVRLIRK